MNATVAESIWRAVLVRLETRPGLDYWRREHFDELLSIASRAGAAGSPDPTELASATAVSWLRGRHGGPLRPGEVDTLSGMLEEVWPDDEGRRIDHAVDIGIVAGSGCGGVLGDPFGLRERPWFGAWKAVCDAVIAAIADVDLFLQKLDVPLRRPRVQDARVLTHVLMAPTAPDEASELEIARIAPGTRLSLETGGKHLTYLPPGAKMVLEVSSRIRLRRSGAEDVIVPEGSRIVASSRDEKALLRVITPTGTATVTLSEGQLAEVRGPARLVARNCTCGWTGCHERHNLAAWDPSGTVTLRSFVASAVKGPRETLATNSLLQGMYVPLLALEGTPRVRDGDVELSVCGHCGCAYEGDRCPRCGEEFDRSAMLRIRQPRLIPTDIDPEPYRREQRFDCPAEDLHFETLAGRMPPGGPSARARNLYKPERLGPDDVEEVYRKFKARSKRSAAPTLADGFWDCPLCGHGPSQNVSRIWARTRSAIVPWTKFEELYGASDEDPFDAEGK